MFTSTLRSVGGSVMMTIPKPALEALGLGADEKVSVTVENGRLVIEPRPRPRYTLEELVAQCDATALPSDEERMWDAVEPVGREVL